jgi:serine/threonine protein kinase
VIWPTFFARALDGFAVLAFDFGITASMFCLVDMSFYQNLLGLTVFLILVVFSVLVRTGFRCWCKQRSGDSDAAGRIWREGVFVAVYLCVFAYPLVSVKVIEVFSCHNVEGVYYLRADYSQKCAGSTWLSMAMYSGFWLVVYVIAFPLSIAYKLWSYRVQTLNPAREDAKEVGELRNSMKRLADSFDFDVHFLLQDYKDVGICFMWEAFEMLRKVMLSVVGSFWSTKSIMCVGTALIISVFFLCTHCCHWPYKDRDCNLLQLLCLTAMSLIYFCGVLLEARSVENNDRESLGQLMVALLIVVVLLIVGSAMALVYWFRQWARDVRYAKAIIEKNPDYNANLQKHLIDVKNLEVGEVLGQGGSAVVRVGKYMGNDVALKIETVSQFPVEIPIQQKLKAAQAEAQMLLPLRHPNVVTLYGLSILRNPNGIEVIQVLELCAGSLQDLIFNPHAKLDWDQKLDLIIKVAQGMDYLHQQGIMHRDLKPHNVLLDDKWTPKIADLGLSKKREEREMLMQEMTTNIGTPIYMAPELMDESSRRAEYDGAMVDVYSFGLVMYALFSREKPYYRLINQEKLNIWTLRERVRCGVRPPVEGLPQFEDQHSPAPPGAIQIMMQCWSTDPFDRPSGFDEIQIRLQTVKNARTRQESFDPYAQNVRSDSEEANWRPGAITSRGASPSVMSQYSQHSGRGASPSVASSIYIGRGATSSMASAISESEAHRAAV